MADEILGAESALRDGLDSVDPRVDRVLGEPFPDLGDFDLVVPSPGIPPHRFRASDYSANCRRFYFHRGTGLERSDW